MYFFAFFQGGIEGLFSLGHFVSNLTALDQLFIVTDLIIPGANHGFEGSYSFFLLDFINTMLII